MGQVRFGPFAFDPDAGALTRDGEPLALGGRAAALLGALVRAEGAVVGKEALIEAGWPGLVVEEGNLSVQIAALRKLLGTREDGTDWIATVPRVGYRLVRAVESTALGKVQDGGVPVLAVLPFQNLSGDPEQEYFADGVVEDVIAALSRFRSFAVIARNSSFVYKGRQVDIREVGRDLGVRYVLEGSVRRSGPRVRVSAQLAEATTARQLWADRFDGTFEDIFDFQDRITESVIGLVEPRIRSAEIERSRRKRPDSLDAYDLMLRAQSLAYFVDHPDYDAGVAMIERAVKLDPNSGSVLTMAAWMHWQRRLWIGRMSAGMDHSSMALDYGRRALAVDSDDPMTLSIVGQILESQGNFEEGLTLINRAVSLNPNSSAILFVAGYAYNHRPDLQAAVRCFNRAIELSPGAPDLFVVFTGLADAYFVAGQFETSVRWARKSLETNTTWELTHRVLAAAYGHLGRKDDARAEVDAMLKIQPDLTVAFIAEGLAGGKMAGADLWVEGLRKAGLPEAPPNRSGHP